MTEHQIKTRDVRMENLIHLYADDPTPERLDVAMSAYREDVREFHVTGKNRGAGAVIIAAIIGLVIGLLV